jgi:hypothetical protein
VFTVVQGMMAVTILLAQYIFLFLVIIGPFVLLAGLIPETGWIIVKNWLGAILGTLVLKTVYALALGVMATMFSLLQGLSANVAGQGGMLVLSTVLFVVIFHQRKRLLNLTGRTSEAVAGAMGVAGQTGKALGEAKDTARDMSRSTTRASGRVARGSAAPVLAVAGASMQRAGGRMNERALTGEDGRGNRFMQRAGRLLSGDPADDKSRGLGGRLRERATRYRMQAAKGKEGGARAAAKHEGGRLSLLLGSLRRPSRAREEARMRDAVERRKRADDMVRVTGFPTAREAKGARDALDRHDFIKDGEFDVDKVLRRDEAKAQRRHSSTRRAQERDARVNRETRSASSATPGGSQRRASEASALEGAAHRRQTTQKATPKKRAVKSERQRWAIIRNTRRRKGKGK